MTEAASWIAGTPVRSQRRLTVRSPFTGEAVGTVALASRADLDAALDAALAGGEPLTRWQRYSLLDRARQALLERKEEFARLIAQESGLCLRETRYEVGRAADVLLFAATEALRDDGQSFSGDVSPQGKARKIYTLREPLRAAAAITPFNHPLNQVTHKVAPAIAAGTPLLLKPSEKTPLTALTFARLLYDAGLPGWMLSVLLGPTDEIAEPLARDERVEALSFTGSVAVGKRIAQIAGYKKLCLELGGNDPLIVCADADLDLAATLAAEGSFRNSGQRCTAVKRLLVDQRILDAFTQRFVDVARGYVAADPLDEATRVGTVIDEAAAIHLEGLAHDAVARGAQLLLGGDRRGALLSPTVLANVPRDAPLVVAEAFGPLAPIVAVQGLDDAIAYANSTPYGLSSGVVTRSLETAIACIQRLHCGTVNINEVPGYRIESSPFGGIGDSGLGIKEGVIEAIKFLTRVKTFSLPF